MNLLKTYIITHYIKVIIAILLFLVGNLACRAQSPDKAERKQLFDNNWKFFQGDTISAKSRDFNDMAWRNLDLPHDWSIEGKISPKNPTGGAGGYFPAGIGWYRKAFKAPAEWKGKKVAIYFEGVYMNSEVFINGKSLGVYPYGYSSFNYDLSPFLDFNHENMIAVRVDNSQQVNSRWYSGSGIYRHVWMIATDAVHITDWGVSVTTPDVSSKKATVQIKTLIKNETGSSQHVVLSTLLKGPNAKNAGNKQITVDMAANSEKEVAQTITVSAPMLWTPETPHLYSARVQVLQNKKIVDRNSDRVLAYGPSNLLQKMGFSLTAKH
jgi:beta-galactosidase